MQADFFRQERRAGPRGWTAWRHAW
jgi:hypothetical protein